MHASKRHGLFHFDVLFHKGEKKQKYSYLLAQGMACRDQYQGIPGFWRAMVSKPFKLERETRGFSQSRAKNNTTPALDHLLMPTAGQLAERSLSHLFPCLREHVCHCNQWYRKKKNKKKTGREIKGTPPIIVNPWIHGSIFVKSFIHRTPNCSR